VLEGCLSRTQEASYAFGPALQYVSSYCLPDVFGYLTDIGRLYQARQESVSSDNDYSEEQYQLEKQRAAPRDSGAAAESEEEKKEKRCVHAP
jgi:hypothetical protein